MLVGNSHASALFLQILTDHRCTQAAFDDRKAGNHHPPIRHLCSVIPCSFLNFSHIFSMDNFTKHSTPPPPWNAKQHVTAVGFLVRGHREENVLRKFFISPDESGGELWENCQTHQLRSHHKASGLCVETFYKTFQDLHQILALLTLSRRDALWHLWR